MQTRLALVCVLLLAAAGCARLGYTDRVLHSVPSPGGQLVAVCQEVPAFDGPEFDVRLERPDGTRVRTLLTMGDGGGCSEVAWAPDGKTLAVVTAHVANMHLLDVATALEQPDAANRHLFHRSVSFSSSERLTQAMGLRFVAATEIEVQTCPYSLDGARTTPATCTAPPETRRLSVPAHFARNHTAQPDVTRD